MTASMLRALKPSATLSRGSKPLPSKTMIPKNQTTEKIKAILGASYTVAECETALLRAKAKLASQAPYFDGRLLATVEKLETALGLEKVNWLAPSPDEMKSFFTLEK